MTNNNKNITEEERFRNSPEFKLLELLFGKKENKMSKCRHEWKVGSLLRVCQHCGRFDQKLVTGWKECSFEVLTYYHHMFTYSGRQITITVGDNTSTEVDAQLCKFAFNTQVVIQKAIEDKLNETAGRILQKRKIENLWVVVRSDSKSGGTYIVTLGDHIRRNREAIEEHGDLLPERVIKVCETREECEEW